MTTTEASSFHYRFIPGVAQYSAGVRAEPGYEIVRVRLADTPPLQQAFAYIEDHVESSSLPVTSVCAFEMRSPRQFSESEFQRFNDAYRHTLEEWGVLASGANPVARSNVIPHSSDLAEPGVHAFSYVTPNPDAGASFVIAGSAEAPEGKGNYRDHIVASDDTTPAGMAKKTEWVIAEMSRRLNAVGADWSDVTDAQVYTKRAYHGAHADLAAMLPTVANIAWHYCDPPVAGLEFEMDCRRVAREYLVRGDDNQVSPARARGSRP